VPADESGWSVTGASFNRNERTLRLDVAFCINVYPSHKTDAQGRLGVAAGERKSLIHRPDRCNIGIDGVGKCWKRIHLGNPGLCRFFGFRII
jgi:hypothetical protein